MRRGRDGVGDLSRPMRLASWRGQLAVLIAPLLLVYLGSISARADLAATLVAPGLASVTGTAQCDGVLLPAATVQLFNGEDLLTTATADATGQFALPPAAFQSCTMLKTEERVYTPPSQKRG